MRSPAYNTACRAINTISFCLVAVLAFMVNEANRPINSDSSNLFSTRPGDPDIFVKLRPIIYKNAPDDLITCGDLVKRFEGLKLKAYRDSAGVPTIGWGTTKGVRMGMTITREQADRYLWRDVSEARQAVIEELGDTVSQQQTEALCSLVYNIGTGAFKRSTLLRRIREGDHSAAQAEFAQWKRAGTVKPKGLAIRRYVEAKVFAL